MTACLALRDDYDGVQLRSLARRSCELRQVRRLLAVAAVYDGMSRTQAATVSSGDSILISILVKYTVGLLKNTDFRALVGITRSFGPAVASARRCRR